MKSKYFCVIGIIGSILFSCKQGESVSPVLLDEISFSEKEQVINCAGNQFSFDLFRQLSSLDLSLIHI